MRRILLLGFSAIALGLMLPGQAKAIPKLQLYIQGGTYDTDTETWVFNDPTADTITLWVIGNVGAGEAIDEDGNEITVGEGPISGVKLAIAYETSATSPTNLIAFDINGTTTGGLGGFTDTSTPDDPSWQQDSGDGDIPQLNGETGPKKLGKHDIYGAGTSFTEFLLGDFTGADSPIADFTDTDSTGGYDDLPTPTSQKGQINVYTIRVTDTAATGPLSLHFDVYDHTVLSGTLLMLCGQAEQPVGRGLNFLLSDPGV